MGRGICEAVGWYGACAILLAYALVSLGGMRADSAIYQLLNVTGAIGVAIVSVMKKAYQPAALNIVWALIGLVVLLRIVF